MIDWFYIEKEVSDMANRLREIRLKKGLTQEELAAISGVSRPTIVSLEKGEARETKTGTLTKLADALGETVAAVFFSQ